MTNDEFTRLVKAFRNSQDTLVQTKGHDYTQASDDRLSNFKEIANFLGLTPRQVWAVYWLKHVFAICTYIKTGKLESEGIESRFLDEQNYSLLGMAILAEEEVESYEAKQLARGLDEGRIGREANREVSKDSDPLEPPPFQTPQPLHQSEGGIWWDRGVPVQRKPPTSK